MAERQSRRMAMNDAKSGKDDLLVNKIAGALLGSLLAWQVAIHLGGFLYQPQKLDRAAYSVAGSEDGGAVETEATIPLPVLLAKANTENGERVARKCASCHSFDQGGRNKQGPNLWGIVGASRAHRSDFNYSKAMKEAGGSWDYAALYDYVGNPKKAVPGTNMTFPGLPKPEDRADLLAYLRQQSDDPVPFPEPETQAEPQASDGADAGAPAGPAADVPSPAPDPE